ncbi:MAG: hypothetical protein M0008_09840 [Actinomycetota bacterium]|nr:hypothetical protein [Actinomycetota bacterium]
MSSTALQAFSGVLMTIAARGEQRGGRTEQRCLHQRAVELSSGKVIAGERGPHLLDVSPSEAERPGPGGTSVRERWTLVYITARAMAVRLPVAASKCVKRAPQHHEAILGLCLGRHLVVLLRGVDLPTDRQAQRC